MLDDIEMKIAMNVGDEKKRQRIGRSKLPRTVRTTEEMNSSLLDREVQALVRKCYEGFATRSLAFARNLVSIIAYSAREPRPQALAIGGFRW